MKASLISAVTLFASAAALDAQVVTVSPTELNGGTLPGSPSEYVIFNGSEYNKVGGDAAGSYKNLPDFSIVGGEFESAPSNGFSTISTPGGVSSLLTGGITSNNQIAVGVELLGSISPTGFSATGFNFDNFNLYVMVDNAPGIPSFNDSSVSLDARIGGVEMPAVTFTLTSHNSSLTSADYVEYNVQGLGTAVAAARAANLGGDNDLVLRVSKPNGDNAILGGIGFESVAAVAEPSTWALMFLGAGGLLFLARRASARA